MGTNPHLNGDPANATPTNGAYTAAVRAAVERYMAAGVAVIPVPFKTKKPDGRKGWTDERWTPADVDAQFVAAGPVNVGQLNGSPSGGRVDVDLDCFEARAAGSFLLPDTGMVWGRRSARDSHYGYVVDVPPKKAKHEFRDPTDPARGKDGGLLLELRSTGGMTLLPPSVAPAAPDEGKPEEPVCWLRDGEPARLPFDVLNLHVRTVAAAALLARHWPKKGRHDLSLPLAGGLLLAGWDVEKVEVFVRAVCAGARDDEADDRVRAVRSTADKLAAGEKAVGWPTAAEMLGEVGRAVIGRVREWLQLIPPPKGPGATPGAFKTGGRPAASRYVPLPPFVPFPTACLPAPWAEFVRQGAAALRCDEALVAVPLLAVLAGAVGNTRRVHIGGEWFEPAVTWTCVVAESGSLKSPAGDLSAGLVKARQKKLIKKYNAALKQYKLDLADHKRRARDNPDDAGDPPAKPTLGRVVVADVTIEKLSDLLDDNPRGLLAYRDELAGWVQSFARYKGMGGGSDEPQWLSIHRADALIYDRKTGEKTSIYVPHAAVSVAGGIQPGVLTRLMTPDFLASGLAARILFAMPPRSPKTWSDDTIADDVRAAAERSLDALYALHPGVDADNDSVPVVLELCPAARARMKRFVNEWGVRQYEAEGDRAAALAKLEAVPGRFALVHHLATCAADAPPADDAPIGVESLEAGIALAVWFANEADRVYRTLAESAEERKLRTLVEHVRRLAKRHGGRATVKQLQQSNGDKYLTSGAAQADLERLAAAGLGDWQDASAGPKGGRPTAYFVFHTTHDETDETPDDEDDGFAGGHDGTHDDTPPPPDGSGQARGGVGVAKAESQNGYVTPNPLRVAGENEVSSVSSCVVLDSEGGKLTSSGEGVTSRVVDEVTSYGSADGYTMVTDADGIAAVVSAVEESGGPVGVDCETTGLDARVARVRLVQVATARDTFVIDLFAFRDPPPALADLFAAMADKVVVGHNLTAFDLPFLARLGFEPARVFDTALASRVVYAGEQLGHDLGAVAEREVGKAVDKAQQKSDWSKPALTAAQLTYAADDVRSLVPIADVLRAKAAAANLTAVLDLEMRCAVPVSRMAARGVGFDARAWAGLADSAGTKAAYLRAEMDALVPNTTCLPGMSGWDWNSNTRGVLDAFEAVGLTLADTAEETLAALDHPLAASLLAYRENNKRSTTYGNAWAAKHASGDRVFATWNQCQAKTGRMSCSRPNLQQIPRDKAYRRCFVARPGHVLVKCDYSQIELRIAAKVTGDKRMLAAYRAGEDLHALTAARFLGTDVGAVTKDARQMAKPVNFGAVYGLGPRSLRVKAKADYGKDMTEGQAKGFLDAFFAEFPAVRRWHNGLKRSRASEVRTLGGRRVAVEPDQFFGAKANFVVQGTGGDGLKRALVLLHDRRAECPRALPVLAVHDEVVVEVPEGEAEAAAAWVRRAMVDAMADLLAPVPVEADVSAGLTWGG